MDHQVFISYANDKGNDSNIDLQVAEKIYTALEAKNIRCWLDRKNISPGAKWPKELVAALERSKVVVLVYSTNTNQSEWVEREINYVLDNNKIIILFRIENVSPQGIFSLVKSNLQWLDAFTPPLQNHIDRLTVAVWEHLKIAPIPPSQDIPPNPFTEFITIHDPARFIGRESEMRRLITLLQGGSVALQGEPKIGKSSLMRQLARHWQGKVIGPLDCMSLEDRDDFFEQIAEALELDTNNWRALRRSLNNNQTLLLVDELDIGPAKGLTYMDIGGFRAVCHSNRDFKMVAASRIPLNEVYPYPGKGSRAYDFLQPYTLPSFNEAEARQLLDHPWAPDVPLFDIKTCEQLLELTSYHPYKLQCAAFYCFESMIDKTYDWQSRYQKDIKQNLEVE